MDHRFTQPVILVLEFQESDLSSTTLSRVTETKVVDNKLQVWSKEKDSEPMLMAVYRITSVRGWYVQEVIQD